MIPVNTVVKFPHRSKRWVITGHNRSERNNAVAIAGSVRGSQVHGRADEEFEVLDEELHFVGVDAQGRWESYLWHMNQSGNTDKIINAPVTTGKTRKARPKEEVRAKKMKTREREAHEELFTARGIYSAIYRAVDESKDYELRSWLNDQDIGVLVAIIRNAMRGRKAKVHKQPPEPQKLRDLAEGMQAKIDDNLNPAIGQQNPTRRRAGIASNMVKYGWYLESIQHGLLALADNSEAGTLPEILWGVTTRKGLEHLHDRKEADLWIDRHDVNTLLEHTKNLKLKGIHRARRIVKLWEAQFGTPKKRIELTPESAGNLAILRKLGKKAGTLSRWEDVGESLTDFRRSLSMGLYDQKRWTLAREELHRLIDERGGKRPVPTKTEHEIRRREAELIGLRIPGFFATPEPVIERMLAAADIKAGMKVLEPSAGAGDIATAIKEAVPDVDLEVVEFNYGLRKILELKGLNCTGKDFLAFDGGPFDRIVMNPPFEKGADIDHVRRAYGMLKPGGRLVSIMGEGAFFRNGRKDRDFREWLEEVGGETEKNDEGAFKIGRFRTTGVHTRLVIVDKQEAQPEQSGLELGDEPAPAPKPEPPHPDPHAAPLYPVAPPMEEDVSEAPVDETEEGTQKKYQLRFRTRSGVPSKSGQSSWSTSLDRIKSEIGMCQAANRRKEYVIVDEDNEVVFVAPVPLPEAARHKATGAEVLKTVNLIAADPKAKVRYPFGERKEAAQEWAEFFRPRFVKRWLDLDVWNADAATEIAASKLQEEDLILTDWFTGTTIGDQISTYHYPATGSKGGRSIEQAEAWVKLAREYPGAVYPVFAKSLGMSISEKLDKAITQVSDDSRDLPWLTYLYLLNKGELVRAIAVGDVIRGLSEDVPPEKQDAASYLAKWLVALLKEHEQQHGKIQPLPEITPSPAPAPVPEKKKRSPSLPRADKFVEQLLADETADELLNREGSQPGYLEGLIEGITGPSSQYESSKWRSNYHAVKNRIIDRAEIEIRDREDEAMPLPPSPIPTPEPVTVIPEQKPDLTFHHSAERGTVIEGDTRTYKTAIKELRFRWYGKGKFWYRPKTIGAIKTNINIDWVRKVLEKAGATVRFDIHESSLQEALEAKADHLEELAEKYEGRSERSAAKSQSAYEREHAILDRMPMGQPIMVGHHSEKRHRGDLSRADSARRTYMKEEEKAGTYSNRAASAAAGAEVARRQALMVKEDRTEEEEEIVKAALEGQAKGVAAKEKRDGWRKKVARQLQRLKKDLGATGVRQQYNTVGTRGYWVRFKGDEWGIDVGIHNGSVDWGIIRGPRGHISPGVETDPKDVYLLILAGLKGVLEQRKKNREGNPSHDTPRVEPAGGKGYHVVVGNRKQTRNPVSFEDAHLLAKAHDLTHLLTASEHLRLDRLLEREWSSSAEEAEKQEDSYQSDLGI